VIQVGQVLDKYELLERVGQGGMAVVYRGLDRALKRVVAVKVLHKHLGDYQEARDRFAREAQAVAKLRHENILEIFDYSGVADAEAAGSSYIITEFIDGCTLKELVTERPLAFPELGALVMLPVCRALAHAHAAGVLHRDVKPENVMLRADGVVKLMDFGISHMVDLERLTVTGQLLGSPAYMAPEHVEGRPLDFRTDVFAAGIVLYQLTVGRLPFEGKNPHEVLKRIAECRFIDPRQASPRVGNHLGRIILRAMAAAPADRYPSVAALVLALEGYLEESGLAPDKVQPELARYLEAPVAYEGALAARLVDHLTRRGQELLTAGRRAAALDALDRVLTIDPRNAKVVAILDGLNRRTRLRSAAIAAAFITAIGGGAYLVHRRGQVVPAPAPSALVEGSGPTEPRTTRVAYEPPPPLEPEPEPGAEGAGDAGSPGASAAAPSGPDRSPAPVATALAELRISVTPAAGSEVRVGDGDWALVPPSGRIVHTTDRAVVTVAARNPCCEPVAKEVRPKVPGGGDITLDLAFLPGWVIAECARPEVSVRIDDRPATLGRRAPVLFDGTLDSRTVTVEFIGRDRVEPRAVQVRSGAGVEVRCSL
jgi:serine/threonine-protein kinase